MISSLGFASSILTQDVIDKLKENNLNSSLSPLNKFKDQSDSKVNDIKLLTDSISTLISSLDSFESSDLLTPVSSNNNITIDSYSQTSASFTLEVLTLASSTISLTSGFTSPSESISSESGSLSLNLNGIEHLNISYSNETSLEDIKNKINFSSDKISATIINTNANEFKLSLRSLSSGDTSISIIVILYKNNILNDKIIKYRRFFVIFVFSFYFLTALWNT